MKTFIFSCEITLHESSLLTPQCDDNVLLVGYYIFYTSLVEWYEKLNFMGNFLIENPFYFLLKMLISFSRALI